VKTLVFKSSIVLDNQELEINASKRLGCFKEILISMKLQLDAMLSHHSRVLVLRVDLHVHDYTETNPQISNFLRKLKKKLMAKYKLTRVGHIWVREIETTKHQHYHLALMLDGHKVNHPKNIIILIEKIWEGWGHPKPFTPKNCYKNLHRNDAEGYQKVFYRLSYLAKQRGKGYKSKTANDYSSSRIKAKKEHKVSACLSYQKSSAIECHAG
jgi:hypothetical protein